MYAASASAWALADVIPKLTSTTTQFISIDPLAAATQSAYSYVNDNPLNGPDPGGLWPGMGLWRNALDVLAIPIYGLIAFRTNPRRPQTCLRGFSQNPCAGTILGAFES